MPRQIADSGRPAAYKKLQTDLLEMYSPANAFESVIVQEFIDARWDFQCARGIDHEYWEWLGGHYKPRTLAGVAEAQFYEDQDKLRLHMRHRIEAERSYYRALAALERMERNRQHNTTERRAEKAVGASTTIATTAFDPLPDFAAGAPTSGKAQPQTAGRGKTKRRAPEAITEAPDMTRTENRVPASEASCQRAATAIANTCSNCDRPVATGRRTDPPRRPALASTLVAYNSGQCREP